MQASSADLGPRPPAVVRVLLADGTAEGLRVLDKSGWTGRCLVCSRADYPRVRARDDYGRAGVYVLLGPDPADDRQMIYIGEADEVRTRVDAHVRAKEFWTQAVIFTSFLDVLNKAHVRYLESRLITIATRAARVRLDNVNAPPLPRLSEADQAEAEAFLAELLLVAPFAGLSAFEPVLVAARGGALHLQRNGASATGTDAGSEFTVHTGSRARAQETHSCPAGVHRLRARLVHDAVLRPDGDTLVFDQPYAFSSPSTAAGVVLGASANGRLEWLDQSGRTLKDLQENALT